MGTGLVFDIIGVILDKIYSGCEMSWVGVALGTRCSVYAMSWVRVMTRVRVVLGTSCPYPFVIINKLSYQYVLNFPPPTKFISHLFPRCPDPYVSSFEARGCTLTRRVTRVNEISMVILNDVIRSQNVIGNHCSPKGIS